MFKNILVPLHIDYEKNHKKLLQGALNVLDNDGKITLLYVNEYKAKMVNSFRDDNATAEHEKDEIKRLEEIAKMYDLPPNQTKLLIKNGSVHREILVTARNMGADAIVMMATRPGIGSYFISSTPERVIRHADCSVFVIRLDEEK